MNTTIQLSAVALTERGKTDLTNYANALVETHYHEGDDILSLLAESAKLEFLATAIKQAARQVCVREVSLYGREGTARLGVSMQVKEVGVSYDYSQDLIWQHRKQTETIATDARKVHESLLRRIPQGGILLTDTETGEEYRAYYPPRSASDTVVLTIL